MCPPIHRALMCPSICPPSPPSFTALSHLIEAIVRIWHPCNATTTLFTVNWPRACVVSSTWFRVQEEIEWIKCSGMRAGTHSPVPLCACHVGIWLLSGCRGRTEKRWRWLTALTWKAHDLATCGVGGGSKRRTPPCCSCWGALTNGTSTQKERESGAYWTL